MSKTIFKSMLNWFLMGVLILYLYLCNETISPIFLLVASYQIGLNTIVQLYSGKYRFARIFNGYIFLFCLNLLTLTCKEQHNILFAVISSFLMPLVSALFVFSYFNDEKAENIWKYMRVNLIFTLVTIIFTFFVDVSFLAVVLFFIMSFILPGYALTKRRGKLRYKISYWYVLLAFFLTSVLSYFIIYEPMNDFKLILIITLSIIAPTLFVFLFLKENDLNDFYYSNDLLLLSVFGVLFYFYLERHGLSRAMAMNYGVYYQILYLVLSINSVVQAWHYQKQIKKGPQLKQIVNTLMKS